MTEMKPHIVGQP